MTDLAAALARIQTLVEELGAHPDPATRERARALVQALLDVHRAGLSRLLALSGVGVAELARDETVAFLLSLHELHAEPVGARIEAALDALRPGLARDGVVVELAEVAGDVARLRLLASGPVLTTPDALRRTLEEAISRRAPEVAAVELAGLERSDVPVSRLTRK